MASESWSVVPATAGVARRRVGPVTVESTAATSVSVSSLGTLQVSTEGPKYGSETHEESVTETRALFQTPPGPLEG